MQEKYQKYCTKIQTNQKHRSLPAVNQENFWLSFVTNDYLGLSQHPAVIQAAKNALEKYGLGSTGSRLLSGNNNLFLELEEKIAKHKNCQAALIFNSGFQANFSVLSALLNQEVLQNRPVVFFDKLNHSSLYQGVLLSKAELIRYRHNDINHLEILLKKSLITNNTSERFIVTETVFGMDGDIAPINDLVKLCHKYPNTFLYLDEAHATGMLGENGYGLSTTVNLKDIPHLIMGTFSKALGGFGAYIACNQIIKNYLVNKCNGFVYSTSLPPAIISAASQAWDLVPTLGNVRAKITKNSDFLRKKLIGLGLNLGDSVTNILPIIIGDNAAARNYHQALIEQGVKTSLIRPPTVPPNSARLRLAITAEHTENHLEKFIKIIEQK